MSTRYQSSYDDTLPFTDQAPSVALAASTPLSYTVPGENKDTYVCEFTYLETSIVFVANNSTAAIPSAGTVSTASRSAFKPKKRFVRGGDVLSFITPDTTAIFGFELRTIPG